MSSQKSPAKLIQTTSQLMICLGQGMDLLVVWTEDQWAQLSTAVIYFPERNIHMHKSQEQTCTNGQNNKPNIGGLSMQQLSHNK
jgi:hypothetical protein